MLKRFEKVTGSYIETIAGQKRFAFSHSDTADFYDLPERLQYSSYPGSVLRFYDLVTGKVYQPFDKRQDVLYGNPVFLEGKYYFCKGTFPAMSSGSTSGSRTLFAAGDRAVYKRSQSVQSAYHRRFGAYCQPG